MFSRWIREFFMLHPGERRGLILVSFLLFAGLTARMAVRWLPARDPPGKELFLKEADRIQADLFTDWPRDSISGRERSPGQDSSATGTLQRRFVHPSTATYTPDRPLNLNAVDSADLLPLPGIGPVYAGRMVRFRNLLGGFARKEQLMEVYGMDSVRAGRILPLIELDTSLIEKIGINHATFRELLRHPYLEYEDVRVLLQYREVNGSIHSASEIRIHGLLTDSVLTRISPYLDFRDRDPSPDR